jgi:hypothetical protein
VHFPKGKRPRPGNSGIIGILHINSGILWDIPGYSGYIGILSYKRRDTSGIHRDILEYFHTKTEYIGILLYK